MDDETVYKTEYTDTDINDVLLNGKFQNIVTVAKTGRANFVCSDSAYGSDSACIQAAINYAHNNNISIIIIFGGVYNVITNIIVYSNISLYGVGYDTVLNVPTSAEIDCIVNSDVATGNTNINICTLKITGNGETKTVEKSGIKLCNCKNSKIETVWVDNYSAYGINLSYNKPGYLDTTYCENVNIIGCISTNNQNHGIVIEGGKRCTMSECHTSGNLEYGMILSASHGSTVENCTSTDDYCGIEIAYQACDSIVSGNVVIKPYGWAGIILVSGDSNNIISNNFLYGNGTQVGICDNRAAELNYNNIITGNRISGFSQGIYSYGLRDVISNNIVTNNQNFGIQVQDTSHCSIIGNICENNGQSAESLSKFGIKLQSATYCTVIGNQCIDTQETHTQAYGIYEDGTSDYNTILGNVTLNNVTSPVHKSGKNTTWTNNPGYNVPSSLSTPALPATTVVYTNEYGYTCRVQVSGGTVSDIVLDGVSTGLTSFIGTIPPGGTIAITYSSVPTWRWWRS